MTDFVHQWIPGKTGKTILLLHGTGGDETDLLPVGRGLAPGAALLSPRGQVNEGGMARFFRRLSPGVFDEADIRVRAGELASFVASSAHTYGFDVSRVYALGYSNGANIAAALLLLHPGLLAGAVLFRAQLPLTPDAPPKLDDTPVLILAGERDPLISQEGTQELAKLLAKSGAKVEVQWQDVGHELTPEDFGAAKRFFAAL